MGGGGGPAGLAAAGAAGFAAAGAPGAAGFGGVAPAAGGAAGVAGFAGAGGFASPAACGFSAAASEDAAGASPGLSAWGGRLDCFSSESLVMSTERSANAPLKRAVADRETPVALTRESVQARTVVSNTAHHTRQCLPLRHAWFVRAIFVRRALKNSPPRKKIPGRRILPGMPCPLSVAYTHSSAPFR